MPIKPTSNELTIPAEIIEQKIYFIRGHKVMLDRDLAVLYGVPTKALNQAVKRNRARFPDDFMFHLTSEEEMALRASRSQNVTLKRGQNVKYAPYVFHRTGCCDARDLATHAELAHRLNELERKFENHDNELHNVFEAIRELMAPEPVPPKRRIGFAPADDKAEKD
jgi:hypothetical protein